MKALNYLFIFLLMVSHLSCSNSDSSDTPSTSQNPLEYYEELNTSYGTDIDQKFDLYLPANRTNDTKVLILIHGGGWTSGDKTDMNFLKDIIRQDLPNIAIVNINYRLADDNNAPYPMQINDITSVINYLKNIDDDYIFSDDYGFIGISAGAHLSLLWSYSFDTNNNSKMVCSIVGPTNFTDSAYLNTNNSELQSIIDLYGIDAPTEFLEEVSPYHQVTAASPSHDFILRRSRPPSSDKSRYRYAGQTE